MVLPNAKGNETPAMETLGELMAWGVALSALGYLVMGIATRVARYEPWPRLHVWHLCAATALIAVVLPFGSWPAYLVLELVLILLFALAVDWVRQFPFLMGLNDSDFPGRHDKLAWVVLLTAFAPVGVTAFRLYRAAHWPAEVTHTAEEPGPVARPASDLA